MPTIELKEMPESVRNLFKTILGAIADKREDSDDDDDHGECDCPRCCVKAFKVPVAPTGDTLVLQLLNALKTAHDATDRRLTRAGKASMELCLSPLSPEAEDVVLQLCVDSVNASVRAERALAALLPEDKRVPSDMLHRENTLDQAREILVLGRADLQKRLDERKLLADAKADVAAAVAHATSAQGGK